MLSSAGQFEPWSAGRRRAGKKQETVEYLDLGRSSIHVAEYLTELPPRQVLRERFHRALAAARARLEQRGVSDGTDAPDEGH